jgi:EmrB/QacA subfamily drug resistance transporter
MTSQKAAKNNEGAAAPKKLTHAEIRAVVIGLMLAMGLAAIDQTIVAPALPTLGRTFEDIESLSWIVTAYLLTATAVTPLYGKLSDIYGRRTVMLTGIVIFVIGSVACALAPTMTALILARGLQGLGGGGLMSLVHTIVADIITPRERGRYQGYFSTVFGLASVGGPILGGFMVENLHWSLIFWINLPIGAAAFVLCWSTLKRLPRHDRPHQLDILGAFLMMAAAILLLLALSWGGSRYPWLSVPIGGLIATSALLWGLFGLRVATAPEPFIPLAILKNPIVLTATLAATFGIGTMIGLTVYAPMYFDVVMRYSASHTGWALIPLLAGVVVGATLAGQTMARMTHYKRVSLIGLAAGILGVCYAAIWPSYSGFLTVAALGMTGLGIGCLLPVTTVSVQNAVALHQLGTATGAMNFVRQLGSAVIVAVMGAILLGGFGGGTLSIETLQLTAELGYDYGPLFRWIFVAGIAFLVISYGFLLLMTEKPLRGPVAAHPVDPEAPAVAVPNPPVKK